MAFRRSKAVTDSPTRNVCEWNLPFSPWLSITFHLALLNVIETLMNLAYLYLAHVARWPPATIVGFGAALMTLSKTILYWAQEYFCGFCAIGHNNLSDLVLLWIIPNGCVRP